jgi:hypothetical protein
MAVRTGQQLGLDRPAALREPASGARVLEEVERPVRLGAAGSDEERPIRLLDVPDGGMGRPAGFPAARLEEDDLAPGGELLADRVSPRQRLRCQDLPSVWTEGA